MLISHPDSQRWKGAIEVDNILQRRSVATASRIAILIRSRLILMTEELWEMIARGDSRLATHATFAAAIKHCPLLGDYLDLAVREQFHKMEERLSVRIWEDFVVGCKARDHDMPDFPETTAEKIRTNVHKVLVEVGYLRDSRSLALQRVIIVPEVMDYLRKHNESYVARCIQV